MDGTEILPDDAIATIKDANDFKTGRFAETTFASSLSKRYGDQLHVNICPRQLKGGDPAAARAHGCLGLFGFAWQQFGGNRRTDSLMPKFPRHLHIFDVSMAPPAQLAVGFWEY